MLNSCTKMRQDELKVGTILLWKRFFRWRFSKVRTQKFWKWLVSKRPFLTSNKFRMNPKNFICSQKHEMWSHTNIVKGTQLYERTNNHWCEHMEGGFQQSLGTDHLYCLSRQLPYHVSEGRESNGWFKTWAPSSSLFTIFQEFAPFCIFFLFCISLGIRWAWWSCFVAAFWVLAFP